MRRVQIEKILNGLAIITNRTYEPQMISALTEARAELEAQYRAACQAESRPDSVTRRELGCTYEALSRINARPKKGKAF